MTRSWVAGGLALTALGSIVVMAGGQQQPTFRAAAAQVSVNVSVRRGNNPVLGLTPADFLVTDNGVAQTITSVETEGVPIDLTLFQDTSPSQAGRIEALKEDVRRIAAMLRPIDRIRVLTLDAQINDAFGWQAAAQPMNLDGVRVSPHSSVYDPIFIALMHRPELDRRHLVVAMTDGIDAGSAVGSQTLLEVAKRAEGVLHLILYGHLGGGGPLGPHWFGTLSDFGGIPNLRQAAEATGGQVHDSLFGPNVVSYFKKAFEDFRQSYVLRYTPVDVSPRGWHELTVQVNGHQRANVRARKGYYGT